MCTAVRETAAVIGAMGHQARGAPEDIGAASPVFMEGTPGRMPSESFGAMLKRLRKQRGLSMELLGHRANLSHVTISEWERGGRSPKRESILAVAGALEVDADEMLRAAGFLPEAEAAQEPRREITLPRGYSLNAPASDPNADRLSALFAQMLEMIEAGQTVEAGVASPERQAAAEDAVREFYGPAGLPENFPGTPAAPPPADAQEGDGEPGKG